jgi:hypothetical protein
MTDEENNSSPLSEKLLYGEIEVITLDNLNIIEAKNEKIVNWENEDLIKLEEAELKKQEAETKRYEAIQKQKEKQRAAIKALLEHTGGNIPELYNKVNEELLALMKADGKLEFKEINFTEETAAFRIPKFAASFNLDGATDFFGMSMAEQFMLYDRVGLFKGIVVDHSKDTPVDQGYRNVVKFLKEEKNNAETKPVSIFYKKPRLSGFFETNFSLDETHRKSQETGIFNLGFGLSVDYNYWATSAALRAGFSYGKEWLQEKNINVKKVAFVSNFFLPKIELSFDTLKPCADDSLVEHLELIFNDGATNEKVKFEKICALFMSFGHFVPTSLVIGGRLYSSNVKKITKMEEFDNEQTQYAASFQAAFSNMRTEVGIEGKTSHNAAKKSSTSSTNEDQTITFNAIGGEGAYVSDTEKWVKSTEKFTHWGLVRFDNLVPIIDLLPQKLKEKCHYLFETIANQMSIEEILKRNAHFMFYSGYFEKFGHKARPEFFTIKNITSSTDVLTIKNVSTDQELMSGTEVEMGSFSNLDTQLWYIANSGKIYSKENYESPSKFVLSVSENKLVVTLEDYFPNQYWKVGGGRLSNLNNQTVTIKDNKLDFVATEKMVEEEITIEVPSTTPGGAPSTKTVKIPKSKVTTEAMKTYWKVLPGDEISKPAKIVPKTNNLSSANETSRMIEKQYISKSTYLQSADTNYRLCFEGAKLVIKRLVSNQNASEKIVYSLDVPATVDKLALIENKLQFLDRENKFLSYLCEFPIKEVNLLNNGNFEALELNSGNLIWHTNSMTYFTIGTKTKEVLSIHHADFNPDMSYTKIHVTVMPFVNADHQLWYLNSKNQLICKARNAQNAEFGLACDNNGTLTMQKDPGLRNDKNLQWNLSGGDSPIIENGEHKMKLKPDQTGKSLSASSTSSEYWFLVKQEQLFGISKPATIVKPVESHNGSDYYDFYNNNDHHYMHTAWVDVKNQEIAGMQIYKNEGGNRYKIRFKDTSGNVYEDNSQQDYSSFDKSSAKFQNTPIYFNERFNQVGFSKMKENHYRIETKKTDTVYKNCDEAYVNMENNTDRIRFVDRNWAEAKAGEKVIGFGLGTHKNRLVPYLIVVPE